MNKLATEFFTTHLVFTYVQFWKARRFVKQAKVYS